jgi:hypothetical protein
MDEFYHFHEGIATLSRNELDRNLPKMAHNREKTMSGIQAFGIVHFKPTCEFDLQVRE